MQRPRKIGETDLHIRRRHLPVAIDVDLQQVVAAPEVLDVGRSVVVACKRTGVDILNAAAGHGDPGERKRVAVGIEVDDRVTRSVDCGVRHADEAEVVLAGAGGDRVRADATGDGGCARRIRDDDVVEARAADHVLDVVDGDVVAAVAEDQGVGAAAEIDGVGSVALHGQGIGLRRPVDEIDVEEVGERVAAGCKIQRVGSVAEIDGDPADVVEQRERVV